MSRRQKDHIARYQSALNELPVDVTGASQTKKSGYFDETLKRALDVVAVLFSLPFVLPLMAILAALIAFDGKRPLYSQLRVGRDGKIFKIWKFRTMVIDSDVKLAKALASDPKLAAEWSKNQKLQIDPRITKIGVLLRKSSLDELPQLWNILNGTMSLVGPRPFFPEQASLYAGKRYFELRPGLTGLWQVSGRNDTSFAERAKLDDTYAENRSFLGDLKILASTVGVVLKGTGY